jgi:hypothetical protein
MGTVFAANAGHLIHIDAALPDDATQFGFQSGSLWRIPPLTAQFRLKSSWRSAGFRVEIAHDTAPESYLQNRGL